MPDLSSTLRELIEWSTPPLDVDAIVGARRRRRLKRRVGVAAAVVLVAAVVTGSVLARPTNEPKVLAVGGSAKPTSEADATRAALGELTIVSPSTSFLGGDIARGTDHVTDPQSGAIRPVQFPVANVQSAGSPIVVGSNLVMALDSTAADGLPTGSAYVVSAALDQWQAIGSASSVFASTDPGRVWIVAFGNVTEQRVDGTSRSQSYPLTGGRTPLAAVAGGLVTTRSGLPNSGQEILEIWNPVGNHVVRTFGAGSSLVAAGGNDVVWDACLKVCTRHVLDLHTGADRVLAPPAGMDWGGEAAISPDGRQLAIAAHTPLTRREEESQAPGPPSGTHASVVAVVDPATGAQTQRRVTTWKGATPIAWSPDGSLLFFARTASAVDYFNTAYARSPVRELAVPGAADFLLVATPTASTSTQGYEYDGQVGQDNDHSAELCIYPVATVASSNSDSCSGPLVVGWHLGNTSGRFHLVGTYDGHVFTLTQAPSAPRKTPPAPPAVSFASGCPTPPSGWHVTNPALVSFDDYAAVTNAARAAPDFAGIWFGPTTSTNGTTDIARSVINVAFTGNLAAHRRDLAVLWGGPLCVVQHPNSYAKLQSIASSLFGAAGRQLGLQMISGGPDDTLDVVHAEVIAATPATRRAIDQRFGKGIVDLTSVLRPVP